MEFRKPSKVDIQLNEALEPQDEGCNEVYLDETSELIGYEGEDICQAS